jgi:hypothetical protein
MTSEDVIPRLADLFIKILSSAPYIVEPGEDYFRAEIT